jgi:hypothetical protein
LERKFELLGSIAVPDSRDASRLIERLDAIDRMTPDDLLGIYSFGIAELKKA